MENEILKEMSEKILQQNSSSVRHAINIQNSLSSERLSFANVLSRASELWKGQESDAELIARDASKIIQIVKKTRRVFFSGKSEKGLLSGLFYLLGIMHKKKKTQREIARSLKTNDVTVRNSYREWLNAFPDLFGMGSSFKTYSR